MKREDANQYSDEETKRRFEAALRGARQVGHQTMKGIPPKRSKAKAKLKARSQQRTQANEFS
jgi:hypothetical protein